MPERKSFWANLDENAERWLLLGFYAMIVATICVEVIRRFVLSYSSIWGEEIARYAFIYLAWVGASAAVKDRAHIRIDVILNYLGARTKALVYLILMVYMCLVQFSLTLIGVKKIDIIQILKQRGTMIISIN